MFRGDSYLPWCHRICCDSGSESKLYDSPLVWRMEGEIIYKKEKIRKRSYQNQVHIHPWDL